MIRSPANPPGWALACLAAVLPGYCGALATGTLPGRLASPDGSSILEVRAGTGASGGTAWQIGVFDVSGSRLLEGCAPMGGDTARIAWDSGGRAWLFDEGSAGIWFCGRHEGEWHLTDWRERYVWYDLPDLLPPRRLFREGASRRMVTMERGEGYSIFICLPRIALDIPELGDSLAAYAAIRADGLRACAGSPAEERATADGDLTYRMLYGHEPSPDGLVCILGSDFEYAGGVHGMYWFRSFVYDTAARGFVEPLSLVGDSAAQEAFCAGVADSLRARLGDEAQDLEAGTACDPGNYRALLPLPGSSGGIDGFRVVFDVYQVACYAAGEQEVVVRLPAGSASSLPAVTIEESGPGWRYSLSCPAMPSDLAFLRDLVIESMTAMRDEFASYAEADFAEWGDDPGFMTRMLEADMSLPPAPDGMLTASCSWWDYSGGAHGNTGYRLWRFEQDRSTGGPVPWAGIGTRDILADSAELVALSALVTDSLARTLGKCSDMGWIMEGAGPEWGNYELLVPVPDSSGALAGFSIHFPAYSVAPYVAGPMDVFIPVDILRP